MSKEEIVEPIKKKKWSYWGIGLLIFTVFFIGLMFLLEAVIQPRESLTATILAYVLGIVILAVFAILVRDKGRVSLSIPILLIIVFGSGYLFNYVIEAPVYNPFAPISERTEPILGTIYALNETNPEMFVNGTLEQIEKYSQYAFVGDLALALPMFFFGTLGLTWVVQIFTSALKIATIFESIFAALFIILGLILTPVIHLTLAGAVVVGTDMAPGAFILVDAFPVLFNESSTPAEIQAALDSIYNASAYFNQTAETLKSLQSAGLITMVGFIPVLGSILRNAYWVSLALAQLTQGIGPFAEGLLSIMGSIESFGDVFNGTFSVKAAPDGSETVKINAVNETAFNEAIDEIRVGVDFISDHTYLIDEALASLENVSIDEIRDDLHGLDWALPPEAELAIDTYADLANLYLTDILDLITGVTILLSKPTGSTDATLVHFFLGWINVLFAGTSIGEITAFNGTLENFDYAYGNFSIVDTELSTPEVQNIINRVNGTITIGRDFLGFTYDLTQVGIPFATLGQNLATGFTDMEGIIDIFDTTDYQNVTNYQTILDDTSAINVTLTSIEADAIAVNDSATVVYDKAQIQGYGFLSDFASGFADTMIQFDMISSIASTKYIANAMYYMVYSLQELSYTYGNITEGETNFTNLNFVDAENNFLAANESLNYAISNMTQSIFYMNQSIDAGMTQLESPRDTLIIIRDSLIDVNVELATIFAILALPDPSTQAAQFVTSVNNIFTILEDVNTELQTMSLS
jgi:hypothetical protein